MLRLRLCEIPVAQYIHLVFFLRGSIPYRRYVTRLSELRDSHGTSIILGRRSPALIPLEQQVEPAEPVGSKMEDPQS